MSLVVPRVLSISCGERCRREGKACIGSGDMLLASEVSRELCIDVTEQLLCRILGRGMESVRLR